MSDVSRTPRSRFVAMAAPLALLLASALLRPADSTSVEPPTVHLVVLHTNDVHGQALPRKGTNRDGSERHTGGLERVADYVARVRAEHVGPNRGLLVVDGGDWWQGTPEGALEDGIPFLRAMADVGYDGMAIGNHEFDLGVEPLVRMIDETSVPALMANVRTAEEGDRVGWVPPWRVVEKAGLRIGLVGLVSEDTPHITHPDARRLHFVDEVTAFGRALEELPPDLDLVVPLTHSGVDADRILAQAFPDLELVVGGHSHTFLRSGMTVGETLVVQAGSKAQTVGRVDLWIDRGTGEVVEKVARLVELERPVEGPPLNPHVAEQVAALAAASEAALGQPVGELAGPLAEMERFGSSSIGNWIADSFRAGIECDLAIHNRGGIRKRLDPGVLTRRDLFELLPFPNTLVRIELSGAELSACLEGALIGRDNSRLEVSGVRLSLGLDVEGAARSLSIEVGGEPLDPAATYRVATNSYLAEGGDRLFALERELEIVDTGVLLRELLERDLRSSTGPFAPASDDRYSVAGPQ